MFSKPAGASVGASEGADMLPKLRLQLRFGQSRCGVVLQSEDGNLGSAIKAYAPRVAQTTVDIKSPAPIQWNFARRVALVFNRNERWTKPRGAALPSMRMAREYPTLVVLPDRQVDTVGVMKQDERCARRIELS